MWRPQVINELSTTSICELYRHTSTNANAHVPWKQQFYISYILIKYTNFVFVQPRLRSHGFTIFWRLSDVYFTLTSLLYRRVRVWFVSYVRSTLLCKKQHLGSLMLILWEQSAVTMQEKVSQYFFSTWWKTYSTCQSKGQEDANETIRMS